MVAAASLAEATPGFEKPHLGVPPVLGASSPVPSCCFIPHAFCFPLALRQLTFAVRCRLPFLDAVDCILMRTVRDKAGTAAIFPGRQYAPDAVVFFQGAVFVAPLQVLIEESLPCAS
jgi:hypothetical protein